MVVNEQAENDVATITDMKQPQVASRPYGILKTAIRIKD